MWACYKQGIQPKWIISISSVRVIQDIFAQSAGFIQSSCAKITNIGSSKGSSPRTGKKYQQQGGNNRSQGIRNALEKGKKT